MEQHQMHPFSPSSGSSSSSSSSSSFSSSSCVSEEQGGDGSYFPHNSIAVPFRWEATPGRPKLENENLLMPNIYPLRPPPIPKDFSSTTRYSCSNSNPTLGEACSIHAKIKKDGRIYDARTIPITSNYTGMSRKLKDGCFDNETNPVVSTSGGLLRKDGRIDDDKTNPVVNNFCGTSRKEDGQIDGNRTTPITSNYGGALRKSGLQSHCKEIQEEEMKQEEIEEEEIEEEEIEEEVIPWNLPRSGSRGYYDAPSSPMLKLKDVLKESAPAFEHSTPLHRSTTCRKSSAHANANNKPSSSSCNPFSLSSQRLSLFFNKSLCLEALLLQNVLGGNKSKSKNKHAKTRTTQNFFLHQRY